LIEVHKYLHTNNHVSKTSSLKMAQLCAVPSIAKLKPSISFKALDAIKSRPQTFGILFGRPSDQPQIYALVPFSAAVTACARSASIEEGNARANVDHAPQAEEHCDARTVHVSHVSAAASSDDLHQFFSRAGQVSHVTFVRKTMQGSCCAHVVMLREECVPKAVALSGQLVRGAPCVVQAAEERRSCDEHAGDKRARDC
jgi:hypothetical protein